MGTTLKSLALRCKRTLIPWVLVLLPLVFTLIFYLLARTISLSPAQLKAYFFLFSLGSQFTSGVLIGSFCELDQRAGKTINDLTCGRPRWQLWLMKNFFFALLLMVALVLGSGSLFLLVDVGISGTAYLGLVAMVFCLNLPLIPVQLWLGTLYRLNGTIVLSLFWLISSSIGGEFDLLGGLWLLVPPVYPTRFITQLALGKAMSLYLPVSIISVFILLLVTMIWYNRFEIKAGLND